MREFRAFESSPIWQLPDPDNTHHMHRGKDLAELVQNIVKYRSQNDLAPIENLNLVISTYLCNLPENTGKCQDAALKRGFLQYLRGGLALVENIMYKAFVSQEEADRRAEICKDCPCNVFPDKSMFIKWSDDIALASIGDRKSKNHTLLGSCEGCSCVLKAKVFYPGPFNLTAVERYKMSTCNPRCWQLSEK